MNFQDLQQHAVVIQMPENYSNQRYKEALKYRSSFPSKYVSNLDEFVKYFS